MSFLSLYEQSAAPSTPANTKDAVYVDTSGRARVLNAAGVSQMLYYCGIQSIATAGSTTTLVSTSPVVNVFTGTLAQTVKLPDATTIASGYMYEIRNNSTGLVTLQDGNAGAIVVIPSNCSAYCTLITAGTVAGVWEADWVGFFADTTTTKQIIQSSSAATAATTLTLSSKQTTSQTLSYPIIREAEDIAVKPQLFTSGVTVANPTGTTVTTAAGVMMGLGTGGSLSAAITPSVTGRVYVFTCGVFSQSTTADSGWIWIRMGTGAAPTNGQAQAGTGYGSQITHKFLTGLLSMPFHQSALVTGLTLGTTYWIDLNVGCVTGGTTTLTQVSLFAFEV
jgi:hypothetical protein